MLVCSPVLFTTNVVLCAQEIFGKEIADGTLKPSIYKSFPLEKAAEAHACMESGANFGKIVLMT